MWLAPGVMALAGTDALDGAGGGATAQALTRMAAALDSNFSGQRRRGVDAGMWYLP